MDTTNKAIADALKKLIDAKNAQPGQPGGSAEPEDPRLKKPRPPKQSDKDSAKSSGGASSDSGEMGDNGDNVDNSVADESDFDDDFEDSETPKGPQIGDRGNKDIQDKEEAERQANAYKDAAEKSAEDAEKAKAKAEAEGDEETAEKADDAKKRADKLAKDAEDAAERARIERIDKELHDLETQRKALEETERAVFKSQELEAEKRKRREYGDNPAARFLDSVKSFIRNQIAYLRTPSWKRFSKRTVDDAPLIQRGRARTLNQKIPLINVYFDHSGSWEEKDIAVGRQAIKALDIYVRKGLIKINVFYFANHVHSNAADARREGGTSACQEILDHIEATNCDNVIIMTDGDMDWPGAFTREVRVDGAVWFVFRNEPCPEITKYLRGKQLTKQYLIK